MNFEQRLKQAIPGGAHTYSRGSDQFPSNAPQILKRGKGAYVFDNEDKKWLDYGMGLRSVALGYANRFVDGSAIKALKQGNNLTRPSIIELHAAEMITDLIDSVEMVKFTKNGSTAVTAALKLARGFTKRSKVLVCRQHPFFSFDDWFIGASPIKKGIPSQYQQDVIYFDYGNLSEIEQLFKNHGNELAAVLLEPATDQGPTEGADSFAPSKQNFLTQLHGLARNNGSLLILDEMITGMRFGLPGAQTRFNVVPDLTTFGKAIANGFPLAFVGGRREIMEQGAIDTPGQERLFLLSTTHGGEMSSLGAMMRTVELMYEKNVPEYLHSFGSKLIEVANEIAASLGIEEYFRFYGFGASPYFVIRDLKMEPSLPLRTLFAQAMAEKNVLMPWVSLSYSHGQREMKRTTDALETSLKILQFGILHGAESKLQGPAIKPVFRKFN